MFYVVFFKNEKPIIDCDAQEGDDVRSIPLKVDERAEKSLRAVLDLQSFELCHLLGQVWLDGCRHGERAVTSR